MVFAFNFRQHLKAGILSPLHDMITFAKSVTIIVSVGAGSKRVPV